MIVSLKKLTNFQNLTILKIDILQFEKLLNILGVQIASKKLRNKFEDKTIQ